MHNFLIKRETKPQEWWRFPIESRMVGELGLLSPLAQMTAATFLAATLLAIFHVLLELGLDIPK